MFQSGSPHPGPPPPTNDSHLPTPDTSQNPPPLTLGPPSQTSSPTLYPQSWNPLPPTPDPLWYEAALSTEAGDGEGMGEAEGCRGRGGSKWWEWSTPWSGVPRVTQVLHSPLPSCVMVEVEIIKEAQGWGGTVMCPPPANTEAHPYNLNYNMQGNLSGSSQCQSRKLSPLIFGPLRNIHMKDGPKYYSRPMVQEAPSEVREGGKPRYQARYQAIPGVQVTSSELDNIVDSRKHHAVPRVQVMPSQMKYVVGSYECHALPVQVMSSELEGTAGSHEYQATLVPKREGGYFQPELTTGQTVFEEKNAGDSLIVYEEVWWGSQEDTHSPPRMYAHADHTSHGFIPTQNSLRGEDRGGAAGARVQKQAWGHLKSEMDEQDDSGYQDGATTHSHSPDLHYVSSSTCFNTTNFGTAVEAASGEYMLTQRSSAVDLLSHHHHTSSTDLEMEVHLYRLLMCLHQAASTITTLIHHKFPSL